jgi:hypothetical protein
MEHRQLAFGLLLYARTYSETHMPIQSHLDARELPGCKISCTEGLDCLSHGPPSGPIGQSGVRCQTGCRNLHLLDRGRDQAVRPEHRGTEVLTMPEQSEQDRGRDPPAMTDRLQIVRVRLCGGQCGHVTPTDDEQRLARRGCLYQGAYREQLEGMP